MKSKRYHCDHFGCSGCGCNQPDIVKDLCSVVRDVVPRCWCVLSEFLEANKPTQAKIAADGVMPSFPQPIMRALQEENELLKHFTRELVNASQFYLGFALVPSGGLKLILPSIERCLRKRGHGQVLFGVDLPTDPEAIQSLMTLQIRHKDNFELRLFQSGTRFFHPKVSIFVTNGTKAAIIGSSNLTAGGLGNNHEANVLLDDRKVVQSFQDYFEEH